MKLLLGASLLVTAMLLGAALQARGKREAPATTIQATLGREFAISKGLIIELTADQARHLTLVVKDLRRTSGLGFATATLEIRENDQTETLQVPLGKLEHRKLEYHLIDDNAERPMRMIVYTTDFPI